MTVELSFIAELSILFFLISNGVHWALKNIVMEAEDKIEIGKIIGMDKLKILAERFGRSNFNFQNLLDVMNTENFKEDLKNPDISFEENKKKNGIKRNKANDLRTEYYRGK